MHTNSQKGEILTLVIIAVTIITGIASFASLSLLKNNKTKRITINTKANEGWRCPGGSCDKCGRDGPWIVSDGCEGFCDQHSTEPNCIEYNQKKNPISTPEPTPKTAVSTTSVPTVAISTPTKKPQEKRCQYDDSWSCDNDCTGRSACYPCGDESYECRTIEIPVLTPTYEAKPTLSDCERCMRENSPSECSRICGRYPTLESTRISQETPSVSPTPVLNRSPRVSDLPPCTQCDDDQKCKYYPELDKRGGSYRFGCTDTGCISDEQCKGYKSLIQKDVQKYIVPQDYNLMLKPGVYYVEGIGLLDCVDANLCMVGLKQTALTNYNAQMPYGTQHYDMVNVDLPNSVPFTVPPQFNPIINPKLINGIPVQGDKIEEPTHEYSDYRPVPIGGAIDFKAPNFTTLIEGEKFPRITNLYSICEETNSGCKNLEAPTSPKNIGMIGLSVLENKILRLPEAGRNIDPNNNAMVLYVCPEGDCIVLKYTPNDNVWGGYTLTLKDGIKVDPNLYQEYQRADKAGRTQLPGVKNLQPIGITNGKELKLTIRDQSEWMDPRSENDWWGKRPPGLKDETILMP